ncbi:MAG TPA: aspartyl protease [Candidatus Binatia bacterium]|nr:aspartyl protease [Candidatus Binatia bacterium]
MGITEVDVELTNPRDQARWQTVQLVADTGAIFSVIPKAVLDGLGITPYAEETFQLADGSEIRRPLGDVFVRIDGKARTIPTIFGEPNDTPILGVTALEILGFTVDPRTRRLEPTKMILL